MKLSILFFLICIPVRVLLAFITAQCKGVRLLSICLLSIATGFFVHLLKDVDIGAFGGVAWWKNYRLFHILTYSLAAVLLHVKCEYAYIPLVLDVLFGIALGISNYSWSRVHVWFWFLFFFSCIVASSDYNWTIGYFFQFHAGSIFWFVRRSFYNCSWFPFRALNFPHFTWRLL